MPEYLLINWRLDKLRTESSNYNKILFLDFDMEGTIYFVQYILLNC